MTVASKFCKSFWRSQTICIIFTPQQMTYRPTQKNVSFKTWMKWCPAFHFLNCDHINWRIQVKVACRPIQRGKSGFKLVTTAQNVLLGYGKCFVVFQWQHFQVKKPKKRFRVDVALHSFVQHGNKWRKLDTFMWKLIVHVKLQPLYRKNNTHVILENENETLLALKSPFFFV